MNEAERARASAAFREALEDPERAQQALLLQLIAERRSTRYAEAVGLDEVHDLTSFRRRVPFMEFEQLAPLSDRMLAGEPDVLVPGRPSFFARTSGTSGRPKHIPYVPAVRDELIASTAPLLDAMDRDHAGASRAALVITGRFVEDHSAAGIPIGSASGFVRNAMAEEPFFHFAPEAVFDLTDFDARYYALLRFAMPLPLRVIGALNPSSLLLLFKKAAEMAPALEDDLARGRIDAGPVAARALEPLLGPLAQPDPDAARRLRAAVGTEKRFAPEVMWPSLSVLQTWKGGASDHYLKVLAAMCPRCVIRPAVSASSEGQLLVPLDGGGRGGLPALTSSVLEFFPAEESVRPGDAIDLAALEQGGRYRIALTNRRVVRYLMDDVMIVDGRHGRVPALRFSHRLGITSSLTGEKLTEADVCAAALALEDAEVQVVDFQLAPEWDDPPRYVLLLEVARGDTAALRAALTRFERALTDSNSEYRAKRESGRLASPELLRLAPGTFEAMRRAATAGDRSDAQVKLVRLRRELLVRAELTVVEIVSRS